MIEIKPIHNFKDHPSLRYEQNETIYWLNDSFYLASPDRLALITIESIDLTNIAEPYRELARVGYRISSTPKYYEPIDIELEDAALLSRYCTTNDYKLEISRELKKDRNYILGLRILPE